MSSKGKKKTPEATPELSVAGLNDKMTEVSKRVSQAAERFAKATQNLNEAMLRMKQLNKKMLTETKKLSVMMSPQFAS
ncbi:MAG: hypothetical protein ACXACI_08825 [Candidatus Hodarchaeales archaeon]|jgi:hypothetical protein